MYMYMHVNTNFHFVVSEEILPLISFLLLGGLINIPSSCMVLMVRVVKGRQHRAYAVYIDDICILPFEKSHANLVSITYCFIVQLVQLVQYAPDCGGCHIRNDANTDKSG